VPSDSASATRTQWERYTTSRSANAREQLLLQYLPLVRRVATRLISTLPRSVRLDDLISAGVMGLLSSLDNFDPNLNIKFETFAVNRIRGAMVDSLRELDWVPRSIRQKARQLDRAIEELTQKLGHAPSDAEIAGELKLSVDDYRRLIHETNATILVSFDASMSTERGETAMLTDLTADTRTPSSQEQLEERELYDIIVRRLKELPDQGKLVLALYYYEELTFKEIGHVLSLTESRVSQIHSKAVLDLRAAVQESLSK
jgi:RNA polymerase sigma factor for flagellar operon FliA